MELSEIGETKDKSGDGTEYWQRNWWKYRHKRSINWVLIVAGETKAVIESSTYSAIGEISNKSIDGTDNEIIEKKTVVELTE